MKTLNIKPMFVSLYVDTTVKMHYYLPMRFIEDFPERQLSHIDVIVIFCTIMTLLMSTIHN